MTTLQRPHSSVGSVQDLRTGGCSFEPPAQSTFFQRIDDRHCDRIHSSLKAVQCCDDGDVGKQPLTWKEYCAECRLTLSQTSPGFYVSAVKVF